LGKSGLFAICKNIRRRGQVRLVYRMTTALHIQFA
jgi:hypothetical protein